MAKPDRMFKEIEFNHPARESLDAVLTYSAPGRISILGVGVSGVNLPMAVETIDRWIAKRERNYVCITSVHGVIESQADEDLRRIHNRAGLVTPDGMPLVWVSRLRGSTHVARVCGRDLMALVCEKSVSKGYRHFLYGGAPGLPERLAEHLQELYPGIQVVGTHSPPFRELTATEDAEVIRIINSSRADIVWVGLSTPKQERWMAEHLGKLDASVMLGVGAAFDFMAGTMKQAPRWMQRYSLEWLYRLISEPRRLWRRYFKIVPLFLFYISLETLRLGKYKTDLEKLAGS